MNRKILAAVGVVGVSIFVLIAGLLSPTGKLISTYLIYKIYPAAFVTDETVLSGGAWGVNIGESKQSVFDSLRSKYANNIYINEEELKTSDSGVLVPLLYTERQFELLAQNDKWEIYFNRNFSDRLELYYSDNRLTHVRRYRRTVEFP